MGNFTFLQAEWPELHQTARQVERYVQSDPRSACFYARRTLEQAVQWLYDHDRSFTLPYDTTLVAMLNAASFRANVPEAVITKAQLIRREGNQAVHSRAAISATLALGVVMELRHILYWLARTYTKDDPAAIPSAFDEQLLPTPSGVLIEQSIAQLQQMDERTKASDEQLRQQQAANATLQAQLSALQTQFATQKAANTVVPDTHNYSEAETRQRIIDVMLREAGWNPNGPNVAEYPVTGMPSNSGNGKVDYVLWGKNDKPLALVEAKRTSSDAYKGKQQALLYADCLERMHGQRPIIFYTNGFETWLWDDVNYPPRAVQGFYTEDELERRIQQRSVAQPLHSIPINAAIVNRPYQLEAIRQMTEQFAARRRKGLLVMATGTGKTRVAIALVDVLMRAGLAKRVLFLADRTALVKQTTNAFKTHLPASNPVNLTEPAAKAQASAARVVVSTYQTMMGVIDDTTDAGQKLFSVGHFDVVVIDEAHRSVYRKYGAIFTYFDSLLLGLTATPKDEVDHNTYRLFDLEEGVPTFAYGIEQAVLDGYLVPYRAFALPTEFIERGIRYDDLSNTEQEDWDLLDWGDSDAIPDSVSANAINAWLFNEDTVDRILKSVMEHGLKVAGGDRMGKTIIFAKNHRHAEFIEQRFDANYPHYVGQFARVIDHQITYPQSLIENFAAPDKAPHIAISVDMLDTGIDIPEVVNLVFFKVVRSKTKFFQMIGRGTRLRLDLFGPGEDKDQFLIFDACLNFEFFNQNPQGVTSTQAEPLSQMLFKQRLELFNQTRRLVATDSTLTPLMTELGNALHAQVRGMNTDNFIVRPQRQHVEPFQQRNRWNTLSQADTAQLAQHVSGLPTTRADDEEETAKRFDLLVVDLQLAYLHGAARFNTRRDTVIGIAANLETKATIPKIKEMMPFLQEVQTEVFWQNVSLPLLETLRTRLRDVVHYADRTRSIQLYTAFKDAGGNLKETGMLYNTSGVNVAQYRKKIEQFLHNHANHAVIQKIRHGTPLKSQDLRSLELFFYAAEAVGGETQFAEVYGQQDLPTFVRSLVGLDRKAAKAKFAQFLDSSTFTAEQIRFVTYIIEHLTANGTITPSLLYSQPYTDLHYKGLDGLFSDGQARALLGIIQAVNVVVAQ